MYKYTKTFYLNKQMGNNRNRLMCSAMYDNYIIVLETTNVKLERVGKTNVNKR